MNNKTLVGVDISKASLDVQIGDEYSSIDNSKKDIRKLINKLIKMPDVFVVCEATGGYERLLIESLHEAGILVSRTNPARVRAFAISEGIKAKTDPIDAKVILKFAKEKTLLPTKELSASRKKIGALLDRRGHLKEQTAREKNRIQNSPEVIHDSITRILLVLKEEIKSLDDLIRGIIAEDPELKVKAACLTKIKGVGEVTAWTVLAFLEEIDYLTRNEVVALAGVAPFNRDSGPHKGRRRIIGGRAKVRAALYMATRSATTHNPLMNEYVNKLRERGKPYKCAIVAGMRKLLIHMHSELKKLDFEVAQ